MPIRSADATWNGTLKDGDGSFATQSGAVSGAYSFSTRFEDGSGTNPEELVAAAQCSAGPHDEVILEGGNHELQGLESQTAEVVSQWLLG